MAAHSRILAWRSPWTEEPGGLQSMGLGRVGHGKSNLAQHKVFYSFPSKEQVSFNFIAPVPICSDFGTRENKICHCFYFFAFSLPWSDRTRCHDLHFFNVEFKRSFSLSFFTFIKRLFSSFSLCAVRVVSSAYLKLFVFLPGILILACDSSNPEFHMMYSSLELNKQGDNIQPCCTPFPILNQSVIPCKVLIVVSWLTYSFLRRQVRWSGSPSLLRIFHNLLWSIQSKAFE